MHFCWCVCVFSMWSVERVRDLLRRVPLRPGAVGQSREDWQMGSPSAEQRLAKCAPSSSSHI